MQLETLEVALILCVVFNVSAFILLWSELRSQRKTGHILREKMTALYASNALILVDHESRLSKFEGVPFRPAAVYERLGGSLEELVREYIKVHGVPAMQREIT